MKSSVAKGAELASGLGAILLGGGLALLAPAVLQPHAVWLLVVGGAVHGCGMTLKYRLDSRQGPMSQWERLLFWLCWASLAGVFIFLGYALWRNSILL